MQKTHDVEIDLLQLFLDLWNGKLIIIAFTLIAIMIGGGFLFSKDAAYESKISYFENNIPPFYKKERAFSDFQETFYSKKSFEHWKKKVGKSSLEFENFSKTKVVNGFVMLKNTNELILQFITKNKSSWIIIKSNNLKVLDDFFKYSDHVNQLLTASYVNNAKNELKIINSGLLDKSTDNIETIISVNRFVNAAQEGSNILLINHPTIPQKTSPKLKLGFAISVLLGGTTGVLYVLISNYIRNRKYLSAKA